MEQIRAGKVPANQSCAAAVVQCAPDCIKAGLNHFLHAFRCQSRHVSIRHDGPALFADCHGNPGPHVAEDVWKLACSCMPWPFCLGKIGQQLITQVQERDTINACCNTARQVCAVHGRLYGWVTRVVRARASAYLRGLPSRKADGRWNQLSTPVPCTEQTRSNRAIRWQS